MTSPCGEMNDAEQPPAIRNEARRTCSSHACEGVKPYFAATVFDGKLSNVHMPSSACIACVRTRHAASNPAAKLDRFLAFIFIASLFWYGFWRYGFRLLVF